ncbi:hypothetical protein [Streptomonospora nanhaiensis]|uniref:hypothetical protein n=1 Tax=Streptomonospora nanhaiensis TaxID=1323731 RepID=UPI001C387E62|nr:hypothetical protein [Streptomonospora nanhaiensis]MBV2364228.1 hypothetical protein [Streptomonospora nanhaiensis]
MTVSTGALGVIPAVSPGVELVSVVEGVVSSLPPAQWAGLLVALLLLAGAVAATRGARPRQELVSRLIDEAERRRASR